MAGFLGPRTQNGVILLNSDQPNPYGDGNWTVVFGPAELSSFNRAEVYHIALQGPASSQFQVYLDTTFYDIAPRGDINSWDPAQPMHIEPGQTIYFFFNSSANPTPKVTIWLREPSAV